MSDVKLTERIDGQENLQIDEASKTIRGVRVINRVSKNGRVYSDNALRNIAEQVNGAKSYIDHTEPGRKGKGRSLREVCGVFSNAKVHADFVTADFGVSAKESWMLEDAKNHPSLICFSINAVGKLDTKKTPHIVESVSALESVDAVPNGGTTKSLFEGQDTDTEEEMDIKALTLQEIKEGRPDLIEAITASVKAGSAVEKELLETKQALADKDAKLTEATAKIDAHEAAEAVAAKRGVIATKLKESKMTDEAITDHFRESLESMDEAGMDAAIADRKAICEKAPAHDGAGGVRGTGGGDPKDVKSLLQECRA